MKKLNYLMSILLACVLCVALTSCSDSDEGGIPPTPPTPLVISDIVGIWQCTSSINNFQGRSEFGLMVGYQITINKDGAYTSTFPGLGNSGTLTISGNMITVHSSTGSYTVAASIVDNVMHWSGTDTSGSFKYDFTKVANNTSK